MSILKNFYLKMIMAKKYRCNRGDNRYDVPKIIYLILPIYDIKWIVKQICKTAPYRQGIQIREMRS